MQDKRIVHDLKRIQTNIKKWEKKVFVVRIDIY